VNARQRWKQQRQLAEALAVGTGVVGGVAWILIGAATEDVGRSAAGVLLLGTGALVLSGLTIARWFD
jgi:hypothetical protein